MSSFPSYDFFAFKPSCPDGPTYRAALIQLARTASKLQRWEDLCRIMKEIVKGTASGALGPPPPPTSVPMQLTGTNAPPVQLTNIVIDPRDLTPEERKLLVEGYKQLAGQLRLTWRAMKADALLTGMASNGNGNNGNSITTTVYPSALLREYETQIEKELSVVCTDITTLVETTLLPAISGVESKVFYYKFVADFHRYLAEIATGIIGFALEKLKEESGAKSTGTGNGTGHVNLAELSMNDGQSSKSSSSSSSTSDSMSDSSSSSSSRSHSSVVPLGFEKKAADFYAAAFKLSPQLDPTHPTRLGLSLNYSVLLYEILKDKKSACDLSRSAFDAAISKLDEIEDSHYNETTLLMQLLRDNITAWTASDGEQAQ